MAQVLLVEDNPANSKLALLVLRQGGHKATLATDAAHGIRLARETQPDLILMDVQLSGMDGLTAAKTLKADTRTRHIKVVAFTAFAMKSDEQRLREAGFDGYIAKPIRYQAFLGTIRALLEEQLTDPCWARAGTAT